LVAAIRFALFLRAESREIQLAKLCHFGNGRSETQRFIRTVKLVIVVQTRGDDFDLRSRSLARGGLLMAYVILEACIDVKDGDCTSVCPVDCIYEGGRMFYIHPSECVNCGLCLSICPVDAILWDGELPQGGKVFEAINREYFEQGVSGLGSPGGWSEMTTTMLDHPIVAAYPRAVAPTDR
jgi:NAD-dependent dihydropyrimidine dehydrogenase PreA subunit